MSLRRPAVALLAALAALACQERLASPADCPALCPGTSPEVRDTILTAIADADSTYDGYLSLGEVPSLLVSNGLPGREARTFIQFPKRGDTIQVSGIPMTYTVDSVVLSFTLQGRDPAAKSIWLRVHRLRHGLDTTTNFVAVDSQLTAVRVIDSILVPDTARAGSTVRLKIPADSLHRITPVEDTGVVAIGLGVSADRATGLRLAVTPTFITYARVDVPDTARQRQSLTLPPAIANYVLQDGEPPAPSDLLYVGTRRGARSLIRFDIPASWRDSVRILRATLELTAESPVPGLAGDPASLQVGGIVADFGAKSPLIPGLIGVQSVDAGATTVSVDVRQLVTFWFSENPPPAAVLLRISPEGGTFTLPRLYSTRGAGPAPQIRVTYARATQPGHP